MNGKGHAGKGNHKTVTLGDIFEIARGGSPRPIDKFITEDPNGVNWVLIGDAKSKYITATKKRITKEGTKKSREVRPGDFLLTNSMSFGRPYIMQTTGCIHDGWLVLSPRGEDTHPDYFYHLLSSDHLYAEFERRASGATVKNLNIEMVKTVQVPLPSLHEQRRVASVLDKADELRAKRRAALGELDALTQSIFLEMFGEKLISPAVDTCASRDRTPPGCEWLLLTEVARLATGHTPDRERGGYWGGDIPWISLTDIRTLDGKVAQETLQNITQCGIDNSSAVLLPKGTVCFSRTASVGFVTVMGREMATSQDFMNWVCGPRIDPTYLMWALITSRKRLLAMSSGSTHRTIYMRIVEQFRVLLPQLSKQREFAQRITSIEVLKAKHHAALAELDAFFASLQHRAFRGEL